MGEFMARYVPENRKYQIEEGIERIIRRIETEGNITIEIEGANVKDATWITSILYEFIDKRLANNLKLLEIRKSNSLDFNFVITLTHFAIDTYGAYQLSGVGYDLIEKLWKRIKRYKSQKRLSGFINKYPV